MPPAASRPTFFAALASCALWLYLTISAVALTLIFLPLALISLPFDKRRRVGANAAMVWAKLFDRLSPLWQTTYRGHASLEKDRPYIFVANHQSSLDIILLLALGPHFKWISKSENFWVPVAGWMMWLAGYVPVRRGDRHSRNRMLMACANQLRQGNSIAIFPEGTRNEHDNLSPFKRGAFVLSVKTGVPIVPICIHGARELLPRNALIVRRLKRCFPHVEILAPVSPLDFHNDAKAMSFAVQRQMEEALKVLRDRTLSQPARDLLTHASNRVNLVPTTSQVTSVERAELGL